MELSCVRVGQRILIFKKSACQSNRWRYEHNHLEMLANQKPTNNNKVHSLTSEKQIKVHASDVFLVHI